MTEQKIRVMADITIDIDMVIEFIGQLSERDKLNLFTEECWDQMDEDDKVKLIVEDIWSNDAEEAIVDSFNKELCEFTADELDILTRLLLKTRPCDVNDSIYQTVQQMREYAK